ncbi:hypothetical protein GM524_12975, partial [Streptococcus pneumoniae]|nr:hypothetical protein [Streptococcus pneumoniae]
MAAHSQLAKALAQVELHESRLILLEKILIMALMEAGGTLRIPPELLKAAEHYAGGFDV